MNRKQLGYGALGVLAAIGAGLYWVLAHCNHKYSRPFTWKKGKFKLNYVTCLNCGKEFRYSMETGEVGEPIKIDSVDVFQNKEVM